jgi:membrane protein DedA with SNARE-associated domain
MIFFPADLSSFLEVIRQNGEIAYSLIFSWASSHSLLLTLFAGYAAHAGVLQFGPLIAVCWLGSFLGDVFRFWLGRKFGARLLARFPRIEGVVTKAALLSERHYVWMILLHRYPHGIRGIAAIAYGISALPWGVFLLLNAIASGIWAVALVSTGYAFGHVSGKVMSDASSHLGFVMLVLFLGLSWLLSRKLDTVVMQAAPAQGAVSQGRESTPARRERDKGRGGRAGRERPSRKRPR